jgi:hypothetical protein
LAGSAYICLTTLGAPFDARLPQPVIVNIETAAITPHSPTIMVVFMTF